jgi:hypothetical protein
VGNADSTGQVCTIVFHVAYSQNMVENQTVRPESCSEKTLRFGTSGTSRGYCFTGLKECSRGHTIDYMQWKWEKKNKKQLISGRAGAD